MTEAQRIAEDTQRTELAIEKIDLAKFRSRRRKSSGPQTVLSFVADEERSPLTRPIGSAATRLEEWAEQGEAEGARRARAREYLSKPRTLQQAIEAARRRIEQGWEAACAAELLGLYALLHEQVYGVIPTDLAQEWVPAQAAAKRLLDREFNGDGEAAVDFLRWVWKRERGREKHRVSNGNGGFRIGWKFQFRGRDLLTEYRVELSRQSKSRHVKASSRA